MFRFLSRLVILGQIMLYLSTVSTGGKKHHQKEKKWLHIHVFASQAVKAVSGMFSVFSFHSASSTSHHLISEQKNSLKAEFSGAEVEQIFQTGSQQLHDHHIIVSFCTTPLYGRDTNCQITTITN